MARYLVIANQTAESPELLESLCRLNEDDQDAEFVLVVPATPLERRLVWDEDESRQSAQLRADSVARHLDRAGLRVREARVGDENPKFALADALLDYPAYAAVVISTLPRAASRWLKLDLISWAQRIVSQERVIHVVGRSVPEPVEPAAVRLNGRVLRGFRDRRRKAAAARNGRSAVSIPPEAG